MNKIIHKLKIPRYETKVIIVPRKTKSAKDAKITTGIQLSFDIETEPNKQDSKK